AENPTPALSTTARRTTRRKTTMATIDAIVRTTAVVAVVWPDGKEGSVSEISRKGIGGRPRPTSVLITEVAPAAPTKATTGASATAIDSRRRHNSAVAITASTAMAPTAPTLASASAARTSAWVRW